MFFMVLFQILSSLKKLMEKGLLRAVQIELLSPECFAEGPQHISYQAHKKIACQQKIQLKVQKSNLYATKKQNLSVILNLLNHHSFFPAVRF
jgi:hypothetical protein